MKKTLLLGLMALIGFSASAQNVTSKIQNPSFEARFAAWENNGMTFQTNGSFLRKNGMVYMEKYVSQGSKVGTVSIKQTIENLQAGTYTLVVGAQNIQQGKEAKQSGAFVFAGNEQVEVIDSSEYRVVFTVLSGRAEIGFKTQSCTGNWVCVDNFRLYYNGVVKDSINLELQKLIDEGESVVGDGVTGPALQTAIDNAKALLSAEGDYQAAAKALSRATLEYRISNATGTTPKVTTWDFVPTGVTIALGRMTVSGSAKERGFCWSTEPNPTVLDNRSTRYFSNNGNIYCIEHLQPATIYYVRPYAMTSTYQVGYGEQVKIATLPKGNVTTVYDNAGDEQTNYRIASAVNEVQWLYDNLANIRGFNLNVHYVPGAGAGNGTADCSYGGWMRVSQNTPYQQTGTILHETNHGVGVGTTAEWYNNSNLRAETSRGLWLGPRANKVIQFLQNDKTATLTGDNTHMWPYGINGSGEDSYNPESTILYYGNVFTTHALHQDGLVCSSSVGFATPAYVFQQDDEQKYFIKSESSDNTNFLTLTTTGALSLQAYDAENADNFAWNITYDPKTSYYLFRHVGTGKYLTFSNNSFRSAIKGTPGTTEKFHLLPAREGVSIDGFAGTGYWITYNRGNSAMQAGTTNVTAPGLNFANSATTQRWLFLSQDEMQAYSEAALKTSLENLNSLIANVEKAVGTPHISKAEDGDIEAIDEEINSLLSDIKTAKEGYTTLAEVATAISEVEASLIKFLGLVKVEHIEQPIDLTFLLINPDFANDANGWSSTATYSYSCCEFYQTAFDFNQTTTLRMPAGTYELKVQAFQRPGSASNTYTDFVTNGTDNVNAQIYLKTKSQKVKNIWADAQSRALGGSTSNSGGKYVPNNMLAASKWFAAGWYENSVLVKTATAATMKLGIRGTVSDSNYWTCFDNFRLYYYGDYTTDYITAVEGINPTPSKGTDVFYDLSGHRVSRPTSGIYIVNGKKVFVK